MHSRVPKLLASSVVRGSQLGESHGGLYLVDVERGSAELKLDWNRTDIDLSGRGGDRGLRGIAFHGDRILVAANAELLLFDRDFRLVESFTHAWLRHCHEIAVASDHVYLTSTGFDSLLAFDLKAKRFVHGFHLAAEADGLRLKYFDPASGAGPVASRRFHINAVQADKTGLWFSGLRTPGLLYTNGRGLDLAGPLPAGTHNAQLFAGGLLYNDTASERICYRRGDNVMHLKVPQYERSQILNVDRFESNVARPGFARGLCVLPGGELIAGGSSPSTIAVYDLRSRRCLTQVNLSMDVRNAIHGLAVWPY